MTIICLDTCQAFSAPTCPTSSLCPLIARSLLAHTFASFVHTSTLASGPADAAAEECQTLRSHILRAEECQALRPLSSATGLGHRRGAPLHNEPATSCAAASWASGATLDPSALPRPTCAPVQRVPCCTLTALLPAPPVTAPLTAPLTAPSRHPSRHPSRLAAPLLHPSPHPSLHSLLHPSLHPSLHPALPTAHWTLHPFLRCEASPTCAASLSMARGRYTTALAGDYLPRASRKINGDASARHTLSLSLYTLYAVRRECIYNAEAQ